MKKKKKSVQEGRIKPFLSNVAWNAMAMNSLASSLTLYLSVSPFSSSFLSFSTNIHTKEEGRKSKKKKKKKTAILVKSERERERKRGQKYQEQDEDEVGMVVMTQYNRVAIRNVTLPSDQLSRPSLLYPTLLPLTTRFVSVTIFISSIFSIRNP